MSIGLDASPASTRHSGGEAASERAAEPGPPRGQARRLRSIARRLATAAALVAIVVLAAALIRTNQERDELAERDRAARVHLVGRIVGGQRQTALARVRIDVVTRQLDDTTALLSAAADDLATMTTNRDDVLALLESTGDRLRTTSDQLGSTRTELDERTLRLSETQRCLDGIQRALEHASIDDFDGAVGALELVRGPCDVALDRNQQALGGPALDASFADPFVQRVGDRYVAYATNSVAGSIQVATGRDLESLRLRGPAVPRLPPWAKTGSTWSPSVLRRGDRWVLYYAVAERSGGSCLAVATAASPTGPFVNEPIALTCRREHGGSIDPSPVVGRDGRAWLVWKVEGVPGRHPSQIFSQQLSDDGRSLLGVPAPLVFADQRWEAGVVEGPSLVEHGGRWVLLYSGANWRNTSYGIGAATCDGPLGPCRKVANGPIYRPPDPLVGAGGQEVFVGPDGAPWLAYHAWIRDQVGYPNPRRLYVARIDLTRAVPTVTPVPIVGR